MQYKTCKTILIVTIIILAIAVLGSGLNNCAFRRGAGEREAELERRAVKYEKLYAETDLLYSEALGTIERSELELAEIRATNSRLREIESELQAENRIFEQTIDELGKLGSELAEGDQRAEELLQAIDAEARRALECVGRLQTRSRETD